MVLPDLDYKLIMCTGIEAFKNCIVVSKAVGFGNKTLMLFDVKHENYQ